MVLLMIKRALIENGVVVNTIIWDGVEAWSPPAGQVLVMAPPADVGVGWTFDGANWTPPPPPAVPVPDEVPQWQARRALLEAGLLDAVEAAVAASTDRRVKIDWEFAPNIVRDSQFVVTIGSALGLTSEQLDNLFRTAAAIKA
jgi:hypothetical protein